MNVGFFKKVLALLSTALFVVGFAPIGKNDSPTVKADTTKITEEVLPVNHDLSAEGIAVMNGSKVGTRVTVTVVNETTDLSTKVGTDTDEDFISGHENWNGIPSVIKAGNNLFVAWYTGGLGEPDLDNYIKIAVSNDDGKTWKLPFMIITADNTGLVWPLFFYNAQNELCLTFGDQKRTGTQIMKFFHADGDLDDLRYTAPVRTGPVACISCKPTLLSDGRLISAFGAETPTIVHSKDGGKTFEDYSTLRSNVDEKYRVFSEITIVEKTDGTLWALRRLENAMGIEQSFSSDGGRTWSKCTTDLSVPPFYTPGSRFYMARLKSGNLLFVTNMAGRGMDRRSMTVWLSEDDGETWPYSLELDPTQSSYPDFFEDETGKIYLVHDRERYGEGGIRLHVFTEEDVKAGKFVGNDSRQAISLTKRDNSYGDIVSVNGAWKETETYSFGTDMKTIVSGKPTSVIVTDDNGKEYVLKGSYRISGFKNDKAGRYTAYFVLNEELPVKLKDGFNKLRFDVVISEKESGCFGSVCEPWLIATTILAVSLTLFIKKRNKEE